MDLLKILDITHLLTIATSIVVAMLSTYLTAKFSLNRFYSEKWWERRISAYSTIIEATHHIREHTDTNLEFYTLNKTLPKDSEQELENAMKRSIAELRKQRDIGDLFLSTEAFKLMNQFFTSLNESTKVDTYLEHLEMKSHAIDKFLDAFRKISRKDLKS
jgi:hypothetical protein